MQYHPRCIRQVHIKGSTNQVFPTRRKTSQKASNPHSTTSPTPPQKESSSAGYYFKNSILQRSDAEYFKDCLQKIVDNIDGQFLDGWGEGGFQFKHKDKYISAHFESKVRYVIADVFNVDSLHVRWDSIEEIDNLDWMLSYKAYYWLYQHQKYGDQSQAQLDYLTRHKGNFFFA